MAMVSELILIAACVLVGLVIVALSGLKAWNGWLALKNRELERTLQPVGGDTGSPEGAARIEIADLKERIRKLEAIASGVDL